MIRPVLAGVTVTALAVGGALLPAAPVEAPTPSPLPTRADGGEQTRADGRSEEPAQPLQGALVVLDPGHQLGNQHFPDRVNALVPAGPTSKACNTTGTATADGFAESTLNFLVARSVKRHLSALGARVTMTRSTDSEDHWGPCIDRRGRAGNQAGADLKISIHADGSYSAGRGFHVIAPSDTRPWTDDIHRASRRLAVVTRAALTHRGVPVADYIAGGDGLDVRDDLGTLNLSDVPTVMVELGNMRSAEDVRRMTTARGRSTYALALVDGARRFLLAGPASATPRS